MLVTSSEELFTRAAPRNARTSKQVEQERRLHDLRNLLSIALANLEAIVDGVVAPAPARLDATATALRRAIAIIDEGP